jgi:hypothetical protein
VILAFWIASANGRIKEVPNRDKRRKRDERTDVDDGSQIHASKPICCGPWPKDQRKAMEFVAVIRKKPIRPKFLAICEPVGPGFSGMGSLP